MKHSNIVFKDEHCRHAVRVLVTPSGHVRLNAEGLEWLGQVSPDVQPIRVTLTTDLPCLISLSTSGRWQQCRTHCNDFNHQCSSSCRPSPIFQCGMGLMEAGDMETWRTFGKLESSIVCQCASSSRAEMRRTKEKECEHSHRGDVIMRHRWNKAEMHLLYWKILSTASTNVRRKLKIGLHTLKLAKATIATIHFATLRTHFGTLSIDFYHFKNIFRYFNCTFCHFSWIFSHF